MSSASDWATSMSESSWASPVDGDHRLLVREAKAALWAFHGSASLPTRWDTVIGLRHGINCSMSHCCSLTEALLLLQNWSWIALGMLWKWCCLPPPPHTHTHIYTCFPRKSYSLQPCRFFLPVDTSINPPTLCASHSNPAQFSPETRSWGSHRKDNDWFVRIVSYPYRRARGSSAYCPRTARPGTPWTSRWSFAPARDTWEAAGASTLTPSRPSTVRRLMTL